MPNRRLAVLLGGALALSLAVNLFMIGDVAGRAAFQAQSAQIGATGGRLAMATRYQGLPPADRSRFRAAMIERNGNLRAAQENVVAAQAAVLAAIQAKPYDEANVMTAFAALRNAATARQAAYQASLASALASLSQADRDALAGPPPGGK